MIKKTIFTNTQSRVFHKLEGEWILKQTVNCNEKWSKSSDDIKNNVYCGTINDLIYDYVLIDDNKAKTIQLKNSHRKAWFTITKNPNASITAVRIDGKKEMWQPNFTKKK